MRGNRDIDLLSMMSTVLTRPYYILSCPERHHFLAQLSLDRLATTIRVSEVKVEHAYRFVTIEFARGDGTDGSGMSDLDINTKLARLRWKD